MSSSSSSSSRFAKFVQFVRFPLVFAVSFRLKRHVECERWMEIRIGGDGKVEDDNFGARIIGWRMARVHGFNNGFNDGS